MRFKIRVMVAIGCVSLLTLSIPAFGVPSPTDLNAHAHHAAGKIRAAHGVKNPANAKSAKHAAPQEEHLASTVPAKPASEPVFGWPSLVTEARKYLGTNPTGQKKLWCATFMNFVLAKVGYAGTHSDAAKSFAQYGHRISEPKVGAIAVLTRGKRGGHVGIVTGIDSQGNPIIISGNHGHQVGEAVYSRSRVIAYVMPSGQPTQVAERTTPGRSPESGGIDSPIAELLAAIEAEQSHAEAPHTPPTPTAPAVPHRVVEQGAVQATPAAARRDLPLDPALARFLGIKERAQLTAQPTRPAPQQRQLRVEQRADADKAEGNGFTRLASALVR
jgi:uncharacterized protein (TIGR02594 family)